MAPSLTAEFPIVFMESSHFYGIFPADSGLPPSRVQLLIPAALPFGVDS